MFAYCNNNPVNAIDPFGYLPRSQFAYACDYDGGGAQSTTSTGTTVSFGFSGSFSLGSVVFCSQLCISADTKGNVELQFSGGDGFSTGAVGGSLMAFVTTTNAPDVYALHGMSYQVGGIYGAGLAFGADAVFLESSNLDADYAGFTISGGFASPDIHATMGYTIPIISISSEFIDIFNEACRRMIMGS